MKHLILLIVIIISGQILFCQDLLVLGSLENIECNFNIYRQTTEPNNYEDFRHIKVVNNSGKIIYHHFSKTDYHYRSDIYNGGNKVLISKSGLKCLYPGDTSVLELQFLINYQNTIKNDILNKFIESSYIYYYRVNGNLDYDSLIIPIKFQATDKSNLFILSDKSYFNLKHKSDYGSSQPKVKEYAYLYNTSDKDFIIDSLKYHMIGNNYSNLRFYCLDSPIEFPYRLQRFLRGTIVVDHKLNNPERSICYISVYGHDADSVDQVILTDSIISYDWIQEKLSVSSEGKYIYYDATTHDTTKLKYIKIMTSFNEPMILTDLDYRCDNGDYIELNHEINLPVNIDADKSGGIGDFMFSSNTIGDKKVIVDMEFEDTLGNKILHDAVYFIKVTEPVGVNEPVNTDLMAECILFGPKLSISMKEPYPDCYMELYGITGELAFASQIPNTNAEFDLSGLPVGIYFITLRSGAHIYRNKIVLIR